MRPALPITLDVQRGRNATPCQLGVHVACPLQHEGMMAIAGVAVMFGKALIDDERLADLACHAESRIQRRVLMSAQGVMHPVEDIIARRRIDRLAARDADALGEVGRQLLRCHAV
jgi:hypothetical protein